LCFIAVSELIFLDVLRSSSYIRCASVGTPVAMHRPFTAIAIAKIKKPGRYAVGNGVYLQITGENGRSWVFRFERESGGKRRGRHVGLGPCALVSLAEAREKGLECRKLLLDGIDPLDYRHSLRQQAIAAAAKGVTFRECAERYVATHEAGWGNAVHRKQWRATLAAYVVPVIGQISVASIDTAHVITVLEALWTRRPETASRVRGRIESILDWAKARGYRAGENPARWRGHLDHLLPHHRKLARVKHHAAMPPGDLPEFMRDLRGLETIAARALEFTILTAARVGEVLGARWDEIVGDVWTVPATRMKSGREHRVPLSKQAIALLRELPRTSDYIFPGEQSGARMANNLPRKLLGRLRRSGITVHGFRSTFRDWAAETTAYPNHVLEMALAHSIPDAVEKAYRRGDLIDKRRRLMEDWAKYCGRVNVSHGAVVALRGVS
jgi:integrase